MKKVSFALKNINTDLLTAINGSPVMPLTIKDWIYNNSLGSEWIQLDENGISVFCMYSAPFTNNTLDLTDGNGLNAYQVEGCYFIAHPIHRPK